MHRIDTDGAVAGLFNEGDPAVPRLPTQVDKHILNAFQEELANAVVGTTQTLTKGTWDQLSKAIGLSGGSGGARAFVASLVAEFFNIVNTGAGIALKVSGAGTIDPVLSLTNNSTGPLVKGEGTAGGPLAAFTNFGAGAAVVGTAGSGVSVGLRGVTGNVTNPAAIHAQAIHATNALYADKTAGDGALEAAVYAKSIGYGVICETTGNVRSAFRIVPRAAAPTAANTGDLYVNSADGKLYIFNGTAWVTVGSQT